MSEIIFTGIKILAPLFVQKVQHLLSPSDLEKAIKIGILAAQTDENKQPLTNRLFFRSEPNIIPDFLKDLLHSREIIEELQKPIITKEIPQVDIIAEIFITTSERYGNRIQPLKLRIEPWVKKFVDTYFEQTVYLRYRVAKKNYLKQLAILYDDIKFSGISVAGQESLKSEKLHKIFVVPDVVEKRDSYVISHSQDIQTLPEIDLDVDNLYFERSTNVSYDSRKYLATQIFSQARSKRLVLLGVPGSGKTILMSFFTLLLTQESPNYHLLGLDPNKNWLPILIRIRDWIRQPDYSLMEYIEYFAKKVLSLSNLPPDFFEYWLNQGQALILLDGLDEVSDVNIRYTITERISLFLGKYNQNTAIITSRPTGYQSSFFPIGEYHHLLLQPFDSPKIEIFIQKWYSSRFSDPIMSSRWQDDLKLAISQNDRIKLLAKNPLLLTIIALIHKYEAYLPRHRHELYNRAVETLLTNWDTGKELNYVWHLTYLRRDSIRRLMERLAYWVHTHSETSNTDGGTLISTEDLQEQLSSFILEEDNQLRRHEARAEANRFIAYIRERSGLLNEQSLGYYAFVHKTFQEYLTTQEIRDCQEECFETVTEHIERYLHNSHWREVLLMLVAQQKRSNCEKVLNQILTYLDPYESFLNRSLFFSVRCLAEDVHIHNSELVNFILTSLVRLDISTSPIVTPKIKNEIYKVAASLSGTRYALTLYNLYLDHQNSLDRIRFLKYKALLGDQPEVRQDALLVNQPEVRQDARQDAISSLISLLINLDPQIRAKSAEALGDLEEKSQQTIDSLVNLFKDPDSSVRSNAIKAIKDLGNKFQSVLSALILLLKDQNAQVQTNVIEVLSKLGYESEDVKQYLINYLTNNEPEVSYKIVNILSNIGVQSEKISEYLLANLRVEDKIHNKAAEALGKSGNAPRQVIDLLLKMLKEDEPILCLKVIETLGFLGIKSEPVISSLTNRLSHQNGSVRYKAVEALERLGYNPEPLVDTLLKLLNDSSLCPLAIAALGRLGGNSKYVKAALRTYLTRGNPDWRSIASEALGNLGDCSSEVLTTLSNNLEDVDPIVRHRSKELLKSMGKTSNLVIDTLLEFMKNFNNNSLVFDILGHIGDKSPRILEILQSKLQDNNPLISCNAAIALIQLGTSKEIVIGTLLRLLESSYAVVNIRAAAALFELGKMDNTVSDSLTQWITDHEQLESAGQAVDVLWDLVSEKHSSETMYRVV